MDGRAKMTQEDKQLLLEDLCSRLAYGVIGAVEHYDEIDNSPADLLGVLQGFDNNSKAIKFVYLPEYTDDIGAYNWFSYIRFKPYLRPRSSMIEDELQRYHELCDVDEAVGVGSSIEIIAVHDTPESLDYLNSIHVDYRGLIPKGLAISTEEFNPYKD